MWSAPIKRTALDGTEYSLLLFDTEGIDAYDQTVSQLITCDLYLEESLFLALELLGLYSIKRPNLFWFNQACELMLLSSESFLLLKEIKWHRVNFLECHNSLLSPEFIYVPHHHLLVVHQHY